MKKTFYILAIFLLIVSTGLAYATGQGLSVDNTNVYANMDKSYSTGYIPKVEGNKAIIVLPLIYSGDEAIIGNIITSSLELGSTTGSPFVYANYEKDISLKDNPTKNSSISSYLIEYEIPLNDDRYSGTYPIIINTTYSTITNSNIMDSFTVYMTITDGKDPNATPPPVSIKVPAPRPQPKLILSDYKISKDIVMAGEEFEIDITILNTEKTWHTKNIVVSFSGETVDITPAGSSNDFYIAEIADEETHDLTLKLKTRLSAEPRPQKVFIKIAYEDSKRSSYIATYEILVEIQQPLRLEYDNINIPEIVSAGDSIPVTMQVFNKGKSMLYNVNCTLEMPGVITDGSSYLGNLQGGTATMAEIYSFFGTLDMGGSNSDEKYGYSLGTMTITYEDEYGKEHTEIIEVGTRIEKPVFEEVFNENEPEEETEKASQWWVSIILLIGVGTILYGTISYKRKVAKLQREYGDENI